MIILDRSQDTRPFYSKETAPRETRLGGLKKLQLQATAPQVGVP